MIVDLERLALLAACSVPSAASLPNFLNGFRLLMKSNPFIATPNTEIPALAVAKPATIAKIPLVIPLSTPLGIELTKLAIADAACDAHLASVPNAVPSTDIIVCISELLKTSASDEPSFLTTTQTSSKAVLNALNAPVSANELIKLLTDLVASVKALDTPLAISPSALPRPWKMLLKSMALSAVLT